MKRKLVLLLVLSLTCSAFFCFAGERGAKPATLENELSADGQQIVDYLLEDWGRTDAFHQHFVGHGEPWDEAK